MKIDYLNDEIRKNIDLKVEEMFKYLDFVECVEQINNRFGHFEQIGYAISRLVIKANHRANIELLDFIIETGENK